MFRVAHKSSISYDFYPSVGVGRIVAEAKSTPTVIPFWHVGELHCVGNN